MTFFKFLLLLLFSSSVHAQFLSGVDIPSFVRVRVFKELSQFPNVSGASIRRLNRAVWSLTGKNLKFQGKDLAESNAVVLRNGAYEIISIVDFTEYLAGVVSNEMPTSWPNEALKAQAVVARSFAIARIKARRDNYFHVESDQNDQVYSPSRSPQARQAVLETESVVLQKPDGDVLKAYYHADCGGQTVSARDVWGVGGFDAGTATDSWCSLRERNRWTLELNKADFAEKLGLGSFKSFSNLVIARKKQLITVAESVFSVQKLRQIFGFSNLKSTPDRIDFSGDRVKISGQGFGHGAGLCQWGTLAQAKLGKSYREILKHYYPRAALSETGLKLSFNTEAKRERNRVSN